MGYAFVCSRPFFERLLWGGPENILCAVSFELHLYLFLQLVVYM